MTELPHVDSFDPEEKDGLVSLSTSERSATTCAPTPTWTPPGTQNGATACKRGKRKRLRYGEFASPCKPLQHMNYHS
jgi:hypothetical protein